VTPAPAAMSMDLETRSVMRTIPEHMVDDEWAFEASPDRWTLSSYMTRTTGEGPGDDSRFCRLWDETDAPPPSIGRR
jgi:hypothetical protein